MVNIEIKNCSQFEMPLLCKLASIEMRNPGLNDAEFLFQADANGFLMAVNGNQVIGSISAVSYDDSFGFIGFHFILPEYSNSGIAEKLLEIAIDLLGNRSIGINCRIDQIDYYKNFGFTPSFKISNYTGISQEVIPDMQNIVSPLPLPFDLVSDLDKKTFLYNRKNFLVRWLNQPNSLTLAQKINNHYSAIGMYLPAEKGYRISSMIAEDYDSAELLLNTLTGHLPQETEYFIDLPLENDNALMLAEKCKMKKIGEYQRMYFNAVPDLMLKNIYSFTNYELG